MSKQIGRPEITETTTINRTYEPWGHAYTPNQSPFTFWTGVPSHAGPLIISGVYQEFNNYSVYDWSLWSVGEAGLTKLGDIYTKEGGNNEWAALGAGDATKLIHSHVNDRDDGTTYGNYSLIDISDPTDPTVEADDIEPIGDDGMSLLSHPASEAEVTFVPYTASANIVQYDVVNQTKITEHGDGTALDADDRLVGLPEPGSYLRRGGDPSIDVDYPFWVMSDTDGDGTLEITHKIRLPPGLKANLNTGSSYNNILAEPRVGPYGKHVAFSVKELYDDGSSVQTTSIEAIVTAKVRGLGAQTIGYEYFSSDYTADFRYRYDGERVWVSSSDWPDVVRLYDPTGGGYRSVEPHANIDHTTGADWGGGFVDVINRDYIAVDNTDVGGVEVFRR
jgi:hypothetical protein